MAICTLQGHVSRALDFKNKDGKFFGIGKSTVWSSEDMDDYDSSRDYEQYPPAPKNTDTLKEIIGYKRVEFCSLVVPDDVSGTLEYRGTKWRIVADEDAVKEGARWVYIFSELSYNELPTTVPYRQVGAYTGIVLNDSVNPAKYAVLPSEVKDSGILEILDNRKPVYRDDDVREKLKIIVEF
jgi:hypothetical protein